ncbi:protein phosphatase 2C containing protein (macronuclear) [Tetrahymena thermophila SB210]|uniref:Protein phosphatase 2C containing protein n=1 Tax=Tetrahymena thermophila (strain SB210) TaxID=312017 RepID=I7M9K1_TETTS|nr:protein phosphatase 2C containing protein [Tetrahymena thermophila SB210]EAS01992.2 protein phosphatase 2C containing protein [Tetrahymena thermophila SB210]|eukprot:XP_001022237.2 protein phosphatase 2C containing protein [Tetrahymena thermophila SB210]
MFLRAAQHKSWENTHTVQQYSIYNDPNIAHRDQMEDAYFYEESDNGECVFGVLDGHNGQTVVEYVTKSLPALIFANLKKMDSKGLVEEALKSAFLEMDEKISNEMTAKAQETGSTCTICLVRIENGQKVIYTANIGDTCAFLYEQNTANPATELTITHRAANNEEKERVKATGAFISMDRIDGKLEVFRAFGDLKLKKKGVIAEPSVSRVVLNTSNESPVYNIVLACDGLWDFAKMNDIDAVVKKNFNHAGNVAMELRNLAKSSRSRDNITVMTVQIDASILESNILG